MVIIGIITERITKEEHEDVFNRRRSKDRQGYTDLIEAELARQNSHIELIASENWVSKAVMAAMGSPLTNKYAEGYPGKRFYGGCSCVDEVETLAIERAKELFGCEYANVQPHSGAQANMAVFFAFSALLKIRPPLGPRRVLCVVVVTTSA